MTELLEVIKERARNLGYDFNDLTKEEQDKVINVILSYAENVFRGMADYPDDRFGRRKGIYKNILESMETNNHQLISGKIGVTSTTYASSCDAPCTHSSSSCADDEGCVDDECTNTTSYCTDSNDCVDASCTNRGLSTTCADTLGCSDTECSNKGGEMSHGGCSDSDCSDNPACNNNPPISATCTDVHNCVDTGCKNQSSFLATCQDDTNCKDDLCCNRVCSDTSTALTETCLDDVCANGRTCKDNAEYGSCKDDACTNSVSCEDTACLDKPCSNFSSCTDQVYDYIACKDDTCRNHCGDFAGPSCTIMPDPWLDSIIPCDSANRIDNDPTPDTKMKTGIISEAHPIDNVCVFNPQCNDTGSCKSHVDELCQNGAGICTDNSWVCHDKGCSDSTNCINSSICYDSSIGQITCIDDNQCSNNGESSYCVDWQNCVDRGGCYNADFCQDEGSCTDGNELTQCINDKCINASSNCIDANCVNGKCMNLKKVVDDQNPAQCTDNRCDP